MKFTGSNSATEHIRGVDSGGWKTHNPGRVDWPKMCTSFYIQDSHFLAIRSAPLNKYTIDHFSPFLTLTPIEVHFSNALCST